jgi:hypothetical protein
MIAVLILFALVGNYLGNLRPNYLSASVRVGHCRTQKHGPTHRLSARLVSFGAIPFLIIQFACASKPL